MKIAAVVTQLMVDLKANPKKTIILGLLLAVAGYFWVPLVGQLFSSSRTAKVSPQPLSIAGSMAMVESGAVVESGGHSWREITEAISEDPNTKPAPEIDWQRNPFATASIAHEEPEPDILTTGEREEDVPDVQIQLLLKGTLVSANKKTALINGESYQQGETVELAAGLFVRIKEVTSRYVVLESNGIQIVLELNTPTSIEASQFRRSG